MILSTLVIRNYILKCVQDFMDTLYFFTLWKGIDNAQSFLGSVLSTELSFHILFSSASRGLQSQEGL